MWWICGKKTLQDKFWNEVIIEEVELVTKVKIGQKKYF
jgi:hypothetical protein